MKPRTLSKGILTIPCLLLVLLTQAQVALTSIQEKSDSEKTDVPYVIGSAGLNNTTNEIDMLGEIINNATVIEKGFVYSNSESLPTVSDLKIIVENDNKTFSNKLTGLPPNTMYYIRPYAINASGISYGSLSIIDTSTQHNIAINLKVKIKTYPNPSTSYISLSGLMETKNYIIYDITGKELSRGNVSYNSKIDVRFLNNGMYLLKLDDFEIVKFIKE